MPVARPPGPAAPDTAALRTLCFELLGDVPPSARRAVLLCVDRTRRADDLHTLRDAVFETVARFHGEAAARARIAAWDAALRR